MKVDKLDNNRLKISLSKEETIFLFGGYEKINYDNPDSKLALNMIIKNALPVYSFELNCKRLLIEVKQEGADCNIYLTRLYKKEPRRFKRIKSSNILVIEFPDSESLINGICRLSQNNDIKKSQTDLYIMDNKYKLIIKSETNLNECISHIREFSLDVLKNKTAVSSVEEYGNIICKDSAVEKISSAFIKKST